MNGHSEMISDEISKGAFELVLGPGETVTEARPVDIVTKFRMRDESPTDALIEGLRGWVRDRKYDRVQGLVGSLKFAAPAFLGALDFTATLDEEIRKAKHNGDFDTVIQLLQIRTDLLSESDPVRKDVEKRRERYKRIIEALADFGAVMDPALYTLEMRLIEALSDGDLKRFWQTTEEIGIDISDAVRILNDVNTAIELLNASDKLTSIELEKNTGLGPYFVRFLLKLWVRKGYLMTGGAKQEGWLRRCLDKVFHSAWTGGETEDERGSEGLA